MAGTSRADALRYAPMTRLWREEAADRWAELVCPRCDRVVRFDLRSGCRATTDVLQAAAVDHMVTDACTGPIQ